MHQLIQPLLSRSACSREEKARRHGLLSIEYDGDIDIITDRFFRSLMQDVCDGVAAERILHRGLIELMSSSLSGCQLLAHLIMIEAVISIQDGMAPSMLERTLMAYLGDDVDLYPFNDYWLQPFPHLSDALSTMSITNQESFSSYQRRVSKVVTTLHHKELSILLSKLDEATLELLFAAADLPTRSRIIWRLDELHQSDLIRRQPGLLAQALPGAQAAMGRFLELADLEK